MSEDPIEWYGLYNTDAKYKQYLSSDTNAHPAKMSLALCDKIFKHLEELGLLNKHDTVVDFMGGTGRTNILASIKGYKTISVELESHFTKMQEQNKEVLQKRLGRKADWTILQGDARKLSSILKEKGVGIVSPPYANRLADNDKREFMDAEHKHRRPLTSYTGIVSPHYGDTGLSAQTSKKTVEDRQKRGIKGAMQLPSGEYVTGSGSNTMHGYTGIVSPPYSNAVSEKHGGKDPHPEKAGGSHIISEGYSKNPTNIGNLKDSELASNLGNQQGESYLSAMLQVYQQAFASGISPLVTVTKNPTKKGKLRRLDIDTAHLLEAVGYKIIDYHKAMLFDVHEQKTLAGGVKKEYHGRLSFFKRLSAQKGNVVAQWEDILIAIIPNARGTHKGALFEFFKMGQVYA